MASRSSLLLNLHSILDGITDPLAGPIHNATDGLNSNIRSIQDRIEAYEHRLAVREELLSMQFQKPDEALKLLSVTQASLGSQIGTLV